MLSASFAPPAFVAASTTAFLLSELADLAVYTPLQRRRFVRAVIASSVIGLVVDSMVFLWLAFGSLEFLGGQIVGKAWIQAKPEVVAGLAPGIAGKIESLREAQSSEPSRYRTNRRSPLPIRGCIGRSGCGRVMISLRAERDVQSAPTNWDASEFQESGPLGLNGSPPSLAVSAVRPVRSRELRCPRSLRASSPPIPPPAPAAKPIASLLFLLIAMDEALSRADLDLLAQLASILVEQGPSSEDYVT